MGIYSRFLLVLTSFLYSAVPAYAETIDPCANTGAQFQALCKFGAGSIGLVVGRAINFIFIVAVLIALGYLIYGAIKWIVSEGDKTNIESARSQIIAAIVGVVIIALSYLIINVLLNFFLGISISQLELPTLK